MERRKFIEYAAITVASSQLSPLLKLSPLPTQFEYEVSNHLTAFRKSKAAPIIELKFTKSLQWLKEQHWLEYLSALTGAEVSENPDKLQQEFQKSQLDALKKQKGFEDFAGIRFIEPGRPSMSLLYHALASPRVKPKYKGQDFKTQQFPELSLLDDIENYIYSLVMPDFALNDLPLDYVLAVFSYEYRPAYKTPDDTPYAEHVFSRTGIARIGECPKVYDRQMRSFSNKPEKEADNKKAAVMPARYGLFLSKVLRCNEVSLYSAENDDRTMFRQRRFLQPIRKIFDDDLAIGGGKIHFYQSHHNEQLQRLANYPNIGITGYDTARPPFFKKSSSQTDVINRNDSELVYLEKSGSSVLLIPNPGPLISIAEQDDRIVALTVEREMGSGFKSDRRYTSLKLLEDKGDDIFDFVRTEGLYPRYKATRFSAPRNAPMFVNIRNEVKEEGGYVNLGAKTKDFEKKIIEGGYQTVVFEDRICEGCVGAVLKSPDSKFDGLNSMPAFSLATAPDFFPLTDSYDYMQFDTTSDSSFLAGGIENLSYCRLAPNPAITNPITDEPAFPSRRTNGDTQHEERKIAELKKGNIEFNVSDTMLAIVSGHGDKTNAGYTGKEEYKNTEKRDYKSTSYLADTSAFVFAPGWEATYSGEKGDVYLATFGLGSPFPEDMKLCAAANGMWPVTSPDAARTFQGSMDPIPTPKALLQVLDETVPPTAIPLMDEEIGIHKGHPGLKDDAAGLLECFGWDGEQGPYLQKAGGVYKVNFTDIGRADYVNNLLDNSGPGFNMALLRELDCDELRLRVECLRKCKTDVEGKKHKFSKLWLVSAEKVVSWDNGARAIGIPDGLVGNDKSWAKVAQQGLSGPGYLYVFVQPKYEFDLEPKDYQWEALDSKRRYLDCNGIIICQVTPATVRFCSIQNTGLENASKIEWKPKKV